MEGAQGRVGRSREEGLNRVATAIKRLESHF
jgi:hypothetical protein